MSNVKHTATTPTMIATSAKATSQLHTQIKKRFPEIENTRTHAYADT